MTPGSFKCPKCDRSFTMAAHLGRHTNTIHGSRRKPKSAARRKPGRPRMNRIGRPKGSRSFARAGAATGDGVTRLLSQMQSYYSELTDRRSSLDAQIAGMESAINIMGAAPRARATGRRPGRPAGSRGRAGSLKDTIVRVLRQRAKALSPKEIAAGLVRAGYKTSTKNLTKAVSNTLPEINNVRKVGRGLYRA